MTASFSPIGVLMSTRSCISAAARSVKVTARISCGFAASEVMRWTIRAVSTCVFPVPAPATTRSGPAPCSTARRCSGVSVPRMSGFGSPSAKLSCSFILAPAGPVSADRPFVLLSAPRVPLRKRDERSHDRTLRPLGRVRAVAVEPERPCDVEVRPLRAFLDRGIEERGGLDRPALASRAVADVGHLTFDLFAVFVGEGHRPEAVARLGAGGADGLDERGGLAEEPGEVVAQSDGDRPGERGDVDHPCRALALRVADPVDEDEPALGV